MWAFRDAYIASNSASCSVRLILISLIIMANDLRAKGEVRGWEEWLKEARQQHEAIQLICTFIMKLHKHLKGLELAELCSGLLFSF